MPRKDWTHEVDFQELREQLDDVPWGQGRRAYQENVARSLGITYSTLRREMSRRFGPTKEVERAEEVRAGLIDAVASVKEEYHTITLKGDNRGLATERCLEILSSEGVEDAFDWHPSTIDAALRRRGFNLPEPRVRVEPDYAGEVFQIDFSRSKHFQILRPLDDGDWLLKVTAKELHYKDGKVKLRTWVCQLIDSYSRLRLVQYYPATSESAILGIHFLRWCFTREEDDHLMRELPERIKSDQGAFFKSKLGKSLLETLEVERAMAAPGNKESQGKVERGFRSAWDLEAALATKLVRAQGPDATIRLSAVREWMHGMTIREHQKLHPTRKEHKRGALYQQSILRHPLRVVESDLTELAFRTWERRADVSCMISIEGGQYRVPGYAAGQWVRIYKNLEGEMVGELIDGYRAGKPFEVVPYSFAGVDDYSERPKQTYAQEVRKRVLRNQKKRALRPDQSFTPESPFEEAKKEKGPERLGEVEARAELGIALRREGYDPKKFSFDHLIEDGMTRQQVQEVVEEVMLAIQSTRKAM